MLLCLVPAFLIAVRSPFSSARPPSSDTSAQGEQSAGVRRCSVSGTLLAVCSCTVLPLSRASTDGRRARPGERLFVLRAGYQRAGHHPPARILGFEMGVAGAVGAVAFSVIIGCDALSVWGEEEDGQPRRWRCRR